MVSIMPKKPESEIPNVSIYKHTTPHKTEVRIASFSGTKADGSRLRVTGQGATKSIAVARLCKALEKRGLTEEAARIRQAAGPALIKLEETKQAPLKPETPTLKDWLKEWTEHRVLLGEVGQSTLNRDAGRIKNHIVPHLGSLRLGDITRKVLVEYFTQTLPAKRRTRRKRINGALTVPDEPLLGPSPMREIHSILNMSLTLAVVESHLDQNPMQHIPLPKKKSIGEKYADFEKTLEGFRRLLLSLTEEEKMYWAPAFLGLRQSERLGLQFSSIVAKGSTAQEVDHALKTGEQPATLLVVDRVLDPLSRKVVKRTKTAASTRTLTLSSEFQQLLLAQRIKREVQLNWNTSPDTLLYAMDDGQAIRQQQDNRRWTQLLEKYEVSHLGGHSARHLAATALGKSGMTEVELLNILGHSTAASHAVYQHQAAAATAAPVSKLGQLFFGEETEVEKRLK